MATQNSANFGTGSVGQVLTSNGSGVAPTFQSASGNVSGPGSSTNRAIATWNSTGGNALFNNSSAVIDSSGRFTNSNQPSFNAYISTNINNVTGAGTAYQIAFDTILFDRGSNFTTGASSHFTAPITGVYLFCWTLGVTDLTVAMTDMLLQLNISGSSVQVLRQNPFPGYVSLNTAWSGALIYPMTTSHTAFLTLTISGGVGDTADITGTGIGTTFSGSLLC